MRKIVVVPHENHWGEKFQIEAERLKAAMPETVKCIILKYVSAGLAAKPIIDMIMEVESIDRVDHWNECFEKLGYIAKGRMVFQDAVILFMERRKNVRITYTCLKKEILR